MELKSKICLGTVQLGLEYGISNTTGKPIEKDALSILEYAIENGIRYIDTAAAYGNAEEIIGKFVKAHGLDGKINIISKLKPNLINNDDKKAENKVIDEIQKSLERLNISRMNGFLLHTPLNFYNSLIIDGLKKARKQNLTDNIGVSVYDVKDALNVVFSQDVNYIQISYNILDQRLDKTDFDKIANANNFTVFSRSPFLQGLLLMDSCRVQKKISKAAVYLEKFNKIILKYKLSKVQAALEFSLSKRKNSYIVFGVDTLAQLKENLRIVSTFSENNEFIRESELIFKDVFDGIVIPSLWASKIK